MRNLWWAAGLAVFLAAGAANANPLDDAKAGMSAFDKGDNQTAVRLFTSAINSHRLLRGDQELAFVKRAQAHIALGQGQPALADAYSALNLDPADSEAIATRDRAQAMLNPAPAPASTEAPPPEPTAYLKSQAAYQEALKRYEEQKDAEAKRYDEQQAKYNAELKAQGTARETQVSVQSGRQSPQTATASAPRTPAQVTAQSSKPTIAAAKPAPKPTVAQARKTVRKPAPPPIERPAIY